MCKVRNLNQSVGRLETRDWSESEGQSRLGIISWFTELVHRARSGLDTASQGKQHGSHRRLVTRVSIDTCILLTWSAQNTLDRLLVITDRQMSSISRQLAHLGQILHFTD